MIQSVSHKYKNVVCLLPSNQLDTEFLKKWFDKVTVALIYFSWLQCQLTIMFVTGMPDACYYFIYIVHEVIS